MAYVVDDIQFGEKALGIGRALRLTKADGTPPIITYDIDNPEISIVEIAQSGDSLTVDVVDRVHRTASFEVDMLGEIQAPVYFIDASLADIIITMPLTAANKKRYTFIREDLTNNKVTFVGKLGTELFVDKPTEKLVKGETVVWITNFVNWYIGS